MNFKRFFKLTVLCISMLIIFACESVDEPAQESQVNDEAVTTEESVDKISVLATTPMIAEYVRRIGNDNIDLSILMPYSADPHSFEASPQDAIKIANSDIVFYVGLKYESANLVELLENSVASPDALIEIGTSINPIEFSENKHKDDNDDHDGHDHDKHKDDDDDHDGHDHDKHKDDDDDHDGHDHGIYDPHFWFDPMRVALAVEVIKDELIKSDSANQNSYEDSANNFVDQLKALDEEVSVMISTIPAENRKIITTHEALGYLETRYGFEVLTTVIPSLNSEDGITPQSLKNTIDVIEKNHIEVMFLEAETSSQYSDTIEQETGIRLVSGLWVETLQENQSYEEWLENNINIIVSNLPLEVNDADDHDHDHDDNHDDEDDDDHKGHNHK